MTSFYESPLSKRYASQEMNEIFSPSCKYQTWRKLWVALAEGEKKLGLPIQSTQIDELKSKITSIDFDRVRAIEKECRHEVMAHLEAFREDCPGARGILHLGATSSYVMDNGDLILLKSALQLLQQKLACVIEKLNHVALKEADTPCLGYTHFQPAQGTTFGKRCALWLQDFVTDFKDLLSLLEDFPFLGCKGAIGTSGSFLTLFNGDHQKVIALDDYVTQKMGFKRSYLISSQTFPRKQEQRILSFLAGLATSSHKCATDLLLLAHLGEVSEPFGKGQVGSSAMPYKRNPILSERICGLSRFVINLWHNSADNASQQWLERSLDDSSNRRVTIPEAFLAADSLVNLLYTIFDGLNTSPEKMKASLDKQLPYLASEPLLAAAVLKGNDRQEVHAKIKKITFETPAEQLLQTLANAFELTDEEIKELLKMENLIGRSKEQVIEFLKLEVEPLLSHHLKDKTPIPKVDV